MYHCHKCGRLCQLHKGKYVPSKECKCNKGKAMKCSPKRRPNSKSESKGVKIDEWLHKHPTKRKSSRRSSSGGFEVKKKKSPVKARRSNSRKGTRVVARRVTVDKISSGYRYSNPLFDEKKMRASKKKKNKKSKNKNKKSKNKNKK